MKLNEITGSLTDEDLKWLEKYVKLTDVGDRVGTIGIEQTIRDKADHADFDLVLKNPDEGTKIPLLMPHLQFEKIDMLMMDGWIIDDITKVVNCSNSMIRRCDVNSGLVEWVNTNRTEYLKIVDMMLTMDAVIELAGIFNDNGSTFSYDPDPTVSHLVIRVLPRGNINAIIQGGPNVVNDVFDLQELLINEGLDSDPKLFKQS